MAMKEIDQHMDFEVGSMEDVTYPPLHGEVHWYGFIKYILAGMVFGIVLVKAEVLSWFRIQEMFRFQSFHMYGVIGSAVVVGMISVILIKKFKAKTIQGDPVETHSRPYSHGQIIGGLLFGFGWALTGACPGPIYAIIGSGSTVFLVVLASAIAGTWVYGFFREKLPH